MNLTVKLPFLVLMMFIHLHLVSAQNLSLKIDTINQTDNAKLKQGWWVTLDANGQHVVEKGQYQNGRKEGIWTSFYPNGKVKHEITFKSGIANGLANFYYDNGQLWETGNWMIDHWIGKYEFFYSNGQKQYEWNYNNLGKRQGEQNYFHENGKVKYTGSWENGKTIGTLKVYNESGKLTEERIYENGKFEKSIEKPLSSTPIQAPSNQSITKFTGTGDHSVYNLSGKLEKTGYFKNGTLIDGEQYIYNNEGVLSHKLIFEKGILKQTITVNSLK